MTKTSIYKFFLAYPHVIDGKLGRVMEFPAKNDAWAYGLARGEFVKDENSHYGILVKRTGRSDVIVCTYEHGVF